MEFLYKSCKKASYSTILNQQAWLKQLYGVMWWVIISGIHESNTKREQYKTLDKMRKNGEQIEGGEKRWGQNEKATTFFCGIWYCASSGRVLAAWPGKQPVDVSWEDNPLASRKTPSQWQGRPSQMRRSHSTHKEHTGRTNEKHTHTRTHTRSKRNATEIHYVIFALKAGRWICGKFV